MSQKIITGLIIGAVLATSGCASIARASGATKSAPNEFNILTKPPLVVPPEYNLRPPKAGEFRAEEAYSSKVAREALLGEVDDAKPSQGEILLMTQAGAGRADPAIRVAIDGSNQVEKKPSGFSQRIMSWRDGKAVDATGAPLDPETEARRLEAIQSATGGGDVRIRKQPSGAKLPGL
ncbi:DUF3035 domain-containing protein [Robiginitomaculum antarcticum]|uniref:DUF3035 domain-containing protein n=1 Tax=Robiginitomaculum antarcticum TaxID=437507 RepID=UPI00036037DF|nr:DUF3035 domain-containing protein [Robiginitomaculum antarcticum]